MASGPSSTSTAIAWSIQNIALGNLRFPSARLTFQLYGRTALPARRVLSVDCWLDTGAPLTVIPFHVHNQRLLWQSLPGLTTTWMGQPCDLGHVDIWLPTQQPPNVRGPLSLLAKFARSDPPGPPLPVLLGLEFFLTHQAELTLLPPPQHGVIRLSRVESPRRVTRSFAGPVRLPRGGDDAPARQNRRGQREGD